jgi:hypothetical protein
VSGFAHKALNPSLHEVIDNTIACAWWVVLTFGGLCLGRGLISSPPCARGSARSTAMLRMRVASRCPSFPDPVGIGTYLVSAMLLALGIATL